MDSIQTKGKNVEEAVNEALRQLNITEEEAEIEVVEEGSRGFLGVFGAKDAVVNVKKKFNPEKIAKTFLKEMFLAMGLVVNIETELKEKQLAIKISGEDMGIIIGKRGQTLDSIQYLVNLVVNKGTAPYIGVSLDTENYRERRKETLETLAKNIAYKVKRTRRPVALEPMNPYERRIIHSALQNNKFVYTRSEGDEPFRHVVIALKKEERGPKREKVQE